MPQDAALQSIIDKAIARGLGDEDIRLLAKEHQRRVGRLSPPVGTDESPVAFLGRSVSNIPRSAGQAVEGTLRGVVDLGRGLVNDPFGTVGGIPGAVAEHYASRYGTPEARRQTVGEDPVGMVFDMLPTRALLKAPAVARTTLRGAATVARGALSGAARAAEAVEAHPTAVSVATGAVTGGPGGAFMGWLNADRVRDTAARISQRLRGVPAAAADNPAVARGRALEAVLKTGSYDELADFLGVTPAAPTATPRVSPEVVARMQAIADRLDSLEGRLGTKPRPVEAPAVPRVAAQSAPVATAPQPSAQPVAPVASPLVAPVPVAEPLPPPAVAAAPRPTPTPPEAYPKVPAWDTEGQTLHLPLSARTKGQQSVQWIQNDLGIAARRARATLSQDDFAEAARLVREEGLTPVQAVTKTSPEQAATVAPHSHANVPPANIPMGLDEVRAYGQMRRSGKTHQQAMTALDQQRALAAQLATPSPAEARSAVAERNATGRWPDGTPGRRRRRASP